MAACFSSPPTLAHPKLKLELAKSSPKARKIKRVRIDSQISICVPSLPVVAFHRPLSHLAVSLPLAVCSSLSLFSPAAHHCPPNSVPLLLLVTTASLLHSSVAPIAIDAPNCRTPVDQPRDNGHPPRWPSLSAGQLLVSACCYLASFSCIRVSSRGPLLSLTAGRSLSSAPSAN